MKVIVISEVFDDFINPDKDVNKKAKKVIKLIKTKRVKGYITQETLKSIKDIAKKRLKPHEVDIFVQSVQDFVTITDINEVVGMRFNHYLLEYGVSSEAAVALACAIENGLDAIITSNSKELYKSTLQRISKEQPNNKLIIFSTKDLVTLIKLKKLVYKNIKLVLYSCLIFFICILFYIVFSKNSDQLQLRTLPISTIPIPLDFTNSFPFSPPKPMDVVPGTTIRIGGSISMSPVNKDYKKKFEDKYPGSSVQIDKKNSGTNDGIEKLCEGTIDIAAASESLKFGKNQYKCNGLKQVKVGVDAISLMVHHTNKLNNLNKDDVKKIFQCQFSNWAQLGGSSSNILVTNRTDKSGTHDAFQRLALNKEDFCPQNSPNSKNYKETSKDEITEHVQAFKPNEISYASYYYVGMYKKGIYTNIKSISVGNSEPDDINYPYRRDLYYVYIDTKEKPVLPSVKYFLGFVGKDLAERSKVTDTATPSAQRN